MTRGRVLYRFRTPALSNVAGGHSVVGSDAAACDELQIWRLSVGPTSRLVELPDHDLRCTPCKADGMHAGDTIDDPHGQGRCSHPVAQTSCIARNLDQRQAIRDSSGRSRELIPRLVIADEEGQPRFGHRRSHSDQAP